MSSVAADSPPPFVSVVVPLFNEVGLIERALASLRRQTRAD